MAGLVDRDTKHSLLLTSSSLSVNIDGFVSSVLASLSYFNQFDHEVDAVFVYDDCNSSCVTDLSATVGTRRIQMETREPTASVEKSAKPTRYSVEEEGTRSVFAISVGKIPPNVNVLLEVKAIGELKTADGDEALIFKTAPVFTPFCAKGAAADKREHDTEYAEVGAPHCTNPKPYTFDIKIRAGLPCLLAGCYSPSHAIRVDADADAVNAETVVISLAEGYKYDREIEVLLYLSQPLESYVAIEAPNSRKVDDAPVISAPVIPAPVIPAGNLSNDGVIALSFMTKLPAASVYGEFIFMVDRSGSMNGSHICNAKESLVLFLKSLPTTAWFNVVSFGSYSRTLFSSSRPYNQENLEKACAYVNNIRADMGGSELLQPLKLVLEQPVRRGYSRSIFLLTDGDISHPNTILDHLQVNSQNARIFAFGIGPKISCEIVSKIAHAGNGKAYFASPGVKIQTKMVRCLEEALQPALCNIKVDWELPEGFHIRRSSQEIPFAFHGQRLNIFASVTVPSRALQKSEAAKKELYHVTNGVKEFWFDEDFASCQLGDAFPDDARDDDDDAFPSDWNSDSDICSQCSDYEPLVNESGECFNEEGMTGRDEAEGRVDDGIEYGNMLDEIPSRDMKRSCSNISDVIIGRDFYQDYTCEVTRDTDVCTGIGNNPFSSSISGPEGDSNHSKDSRYTKNIIDSDTWYFDIGYTAVNPFTDYTNHATMHTSAETETTSNSVASLTTTRNTGEKASRRNSFDNRKNNNYTTESTFTDNTNHDTIESRGETDTTNNYFGTSMAERNTSGKMTSVRNTFDNLNNNASYTTAKTFTDCTNYATTDISGDTDTTNNPFVILKKDRKMACESCDLDNSNTFTTTQTNSKDYITDNTRNRSPCNDYSNRRNYSRTNIAENITDKDYSDSDKAVPKSERNTKKCTLSTVSTLSDTVTTFDANKRNIRLRNLVDERAITNETAVTSSCSVAKRVSTEVTPVPNHRLRNNSQPLLADLYDEPSPLSHRAGCHEDSSDNLTTRNSQTDDSLTLSRYNENWLSQLTKRNSITEGNLHSGSGCRSRDWGCHQRDWGTAVVTGYVGPDVFRKKIPFRLKVTPSSHQRRDLHQVAALSFIRSMEYMLERRQEAGVENDIVELSKSSGMPSRLTSQVMVDQQGEIIGERQDSLHLKITRKQRPFLSSPAHNVLVRPTRSPDDPPAILVSCPSVDEEPRSPPKRRHRGTRGEEIDESDEEGQYYCVERLAPEGCDDVRSRSDTTGACDYHRRFVDYRNMPNQRRKIVSARLTLLTRKMKHAQKLNVFAGPRFIRLILLQAAQGYWQLTYAFAKIVELPLVQLELSAPFADCTMIPLGEKDGQLGIDGYYDSLSLWATAIALVYLKRKWKSREEEWQLVVRKGEVWLKQQNFPQGFAYHDVMLAARQAIVLLEQKYRSRATSEPVGLIK